MHYKDYFRMMDEEHIKTIEKDITYYQIRYIARMNEKNLAMADTINQLIDVLKKELSNARADHSRDYGSQVSSTPNTRDKTVFIIKR